ncbi:transcriptional regulator [Klebsiella variicola]
MNSDVLLMVLTENNWLYAGLAALLPEMVCMKMRFNISRPPHEVNEARRVVIAVDSLLFFRGEWTAFNNLKALRPDAIVVWLTREVTGRMFPVESRGERILAQTLDIVSLRQALRQASHWAKSLSDDECVVAANLTLTERCLLPYFLSGLSIHAVARLTGRAVKTLYTCRHRILEKTGFRQAIFLQFVHERNQGLPGIRGLGTLVNNSHRNMRAGVNVPYYRRNS